MLFEHLIYSTAIAIIAGMIWYKRTGRDPSWIIIASAYAPDFDIVAGELFKKLDMNILFDGAPIKHGDFHNIAFLLLFASAVALVLRLAGMRFGDSFMFAGIGFGAHIFEDVLVFNPGYAFFWPLYEQRFSIGMLEYKSDFYKIANTDLLIIGVMIMGFFGIIRLLYEDKTNIKRTAKIYGIVVVLIILMVPVFIFLDINLMERVNLINERSYIDKWMFTRDTSRDSTVFLGGGHSAKIDISGSENKISGIWLSDQTLAEPNTTYTFSGWGKIEGIGGNKSTLIRVEERDANNILLSQRNLEFGNGTNNWTKKQITFRTFNKTNRIQVQIVIWKGYGTFWVDDVKLSKEGIDGNLILNSGFEDDIKSYLIPEFDKR